MQQVAAAVTAQSRDGLCIVAKEKKSRLAQPCSKGFSLYYSAFSCKTQIPTLHNASFDETSVRFYSNFFIHMHQNRFKYVENKYLGLYIHISCLIFAKIAKDNVKNSLKIGKKFTKTYIVHCSEPFQIAGWM